MTVISRQLSLKHKKLFVSGFARETVGSLIPVDLIKIIRWYMDEVLYWSMEGKFLRKFCSKKTGQILYSSTFNFNQIEFCAYWYPNGNSKPYKDQTIFGVTLCDFPPEVESITIYYHLECHKFDCVWKSIHTFKQSDESSAFNNCIGWNPFNMKLSECRKQRKIDFSCYVNVLRVIYKEGESRQIDAVTECIDRFSQITKYQWYLSPEHIEKCSRCELGKTFYSDNFGEIDNYCLFIAPKGFNQEGAEAQIANNSNYLMLYLRLLRLPLNIKTMGIRYEIRATYVTKDRGTNQIATYRYHPEHKVKESKLIYVSYSFSDCTKGCLLERIPNIVELESLCIDIKVEVENMVDMNDKTIPKDQWEEYGVLRNGGRLKNALRSSMSWRENTFV